MDTYYQLFDLESGNLIGEFDLESDAWQALRSLKREELYRLGLVQMRGSEVTLVAMDEDLARRVHDTLVPFRTVEPIKRKAQ
jgi:hypothetical protein